MLSLRRAALFLVGCAMVAVSRAASADPPAAPPSSAPALPAASAASPAVANLAAVPIPAPNGTPVDFDADKPLLSVYVAPGAFADTAPRYPDPFVKIGR